jgi:hypothetical protein
MAVGRLADQVVTLERGAQPSAHRGDEAGHPDQDGRGRREVEEPDPIADPGIGACSHRSCAAISAALLTTTVAA